MRNVILAILFLFVFTSCDDHGTFKESSTVEEAKAVADGYFKDFDQTYNDLCDSPENDSKMANIMNLQKNLLDLDNCGVLCIKLSYEDQKTVRSYAIRKMKDYPHLRKLAYFDEMECSPNFSK